jgi:hypothetical protein
MAMQDRSLRISDGRRRVDVDLTPRRSQLAVSDRVHNAMSKFSGGRGVRHLASAYQTRSIYFELVLSFPNQSG